MSVRTVAQIEDSLMIGTTRTSVPLANYPRRDTGYTRRRNELDSSRGLMKGLIIGVGAWTVMVGAAALTLQLL